MLSLSNFKKFEINSDVIKGGISCSDALDVIEYLASHDEGSNEHEQAKVLVAGYVNGTLQCD